jgi:NADPH2:quinone reductase
MQLQPELVRDAATELLELWTEGAIRPVVGAELPLEQAAEAHRLIDERRHVAKVVLVP